MTDPLVLPASSSWRAPTTMSSPSMATAEPNVSPDAASLAMSLATSVHWPERRSKT